MPQGQAAVSWSDKKDVELFLTVLAVQKITIDYAAVAAAFGMAYFSFPHKLLKILLDDPSRTNFVLQSLGPCH